MKSKSKTTFTVNRDKLEVIMARVFDAPRELVWKAFTDPELIPQWWGPREKTTTVEKMDLRVGGAWRYVCSEGNREDAFYGIFTEIKAPERISHTFNYEPTGPGHELFETAIFEEMEGGKTKMTTISKYQHIKDLEGMVNAGMEAGATESCDRLAELTEKA